MSGRSFSGQAGIQVAATFISVGIGLVFGAIAGLVAYCFYSLESERHYQDWEYFEYNDEDIFGTSLKLKGSHN